MENKYFGMVVAIAIVLLLFAFVKNAPQISFISKIVAPKVVVPNNDLSLITEPNAGIAPVLALIRSASTSADLVMYELEDKRIEAALVADEKRGISVRVLLSNGYKGESFAANEPAYNFLHANGVPVEWTQGYFALTHQKSLVVDNATALIMTFNLTSQYYSTSRDFGIVDKDQNDIAAMNQVFDNDWKGNDVPANNGDDLVWSPGSESAMLALVNGARRSLDIYNEEMADPRITKALIEAAQRGVVVNIDMTYSPEWKNAFEELATAGANVRTYDPNASLYIHAKMILADSLRGFVGSENFSANSLDDNRELGIITTDPSIITSLTKTFNADWKSATPFSP